MRRIVRRLVLSLAFAWMCLAPADVRAHAIEVVHAFPAKPSRPYGTLLQLADGVFLGTTSEGGAYQKGSIYALFRVGDGTWDTYVVHSFSGPDGAFPMAGLIRASDGNFYGTTRDGGANRLGTLYRMTIAGAVTTLHDFGGPDGEHPEAALVQAPDGRLWGTAKRGGDFGSGTIFRLTLAGAFTRIRGFPTVADGASPQSLIVGPDGRLYGTTEVGGSNIFRGGTLFRLTTAGTGFTVLHSFEQPGPKGLARGRDGRIYGTASGGGPQSRGAFFQVTPATGAVALSFPFDGPGARAAIPLSPPIHAADGSFYGTADVDPAAPSEADVIYRLTPAGEVEQLGLLTGPLGIMSQALVLATDGRLYGTTLTGERPLPPQEPNYGSGAAFSVDPSSPGTTLLRSFSTDTPSGPAGPLVEGVDGNLYGTSCYGGIYNRGTVFRLAAGAVTTLHSFSGHDGLCPASGLIAGPDGAFYATTTSGLYLVTPATVFRVTSDGDFRVVWQSPPDGPGFALAAPTFGTDGQLYVPFSNILGGSGRILRMTIDGVVTMDVSLNVLAVSGTWPTGRLLLAPDGNFYGTTASHVGGVFRMTTSGELSPVHLFEDDATLRLRTGLTLGADGRLYGAGMQGGASDVGFVYSTTTSGDVEIEHEFALTDGGLPWGDLLEVSPGQFMGLTHAFGQHQYGTIFTVGADGSFSTDHHFDWVDGANPFGGLMRTAAGAIYGTAHRGGALSGGVIYRVIQ